MSPETKMAFDIALEMAHSEGVLLFGYIVDPKSKAISAFSNQSDSIEDILANTESAVSVLNSNPQTVTQRIIHHA